MVNTLEDCATLLCEYYRQGNLKIYCLDTDECLSYQGLFDSNNLDAYIIIDTKYDFDTGVITYNVKRSSINGTL